MFYRKVIFSAEIERLRKGEAAERRAVRRPDAGCPPSPGSELRPRGVGLEVRHGGTPAPPGSRPLRGPLPRRANAFPSRAVLRRSLPELQLRTHCAAAGGRPALLGMVLPYGAGVDAEKVAVCFWELLTAVREQSKSGGSRTVGT